MWRAARDTWRRGMRCCGGKSSGCEARRDAETIHQVVGERQLGGGDRGSNGGKQHAPLLDAPLRTVRVLSIECTAWTLDPGPWTLLGGHHHGRQPAHCRQQLHLVGVEQPGGPEGGGRAQQDGTFLPELRLRAVQQCHGGTADASLRRGGQCTRATCASGVVDGSRS